jgi:6-phosphofructokinase 1
MAEAEIFDHMVAWTPPDMSSVPIEDAIRRRKKVDLSSDKVLTAREIGICLGD